MPKWASRLGGWVLSQLSWTLLWWVLVAGGGAAVIAAVSTAYSGIHGALRYLLLVGAFMFGVGVLIAVIRLVVIALPGGASAELHQGPSVSGATTAGAQERNPRVAIHEVITNLEDQQAIIRAL